MTRLRVDVVIVTCAISAGIHGALAPEHFDEGAGAGVGFGAATVLLAGLLVVLTYRPTSRVALGSAVLLFAGLIGSYALVVATGLPLLHPEAEPVDGPARFTKGIEAVGLAAAATLVWQRPELLQPKGT